MHRPRIRLSWRPAVTRHPNRPVRAIGRVLSPYAASLAVSVVCAVPLAACATAPSRPAEPAAVINTDRVPQACLDALDGADDLTVYLGAREQSRDRLVIAQAQKWTQTESRESVEDLQRQVAALTVKVGRSVAKYAAARDACRDEYKAAS